MKRSLACACVLLASRAAQSADDWHFQAVVYGYLPSIGGSTTFSSAGGPDVGIDPDDILEHLKFAFMGAFDASTARTGVLADVIYANLGETRSNLGLSLQGWLWTVAGTYSVMDTPQQRLQLLAGARLLDMRQDLDLELGGLSRRASTTSTNWDAIVGVRGRLAFGGQRNWFAPYYLDLGAGESDFTWQALTGVGYSFRWSDVLVAWRHTDYDRKAGTSVQRLSLDGPAIGVAVRW
jgi:hypothetical protein